MKTRPYRPSDALVALLCCLGVACTSTSKAPSDDRPFVPIGDPEVHTIGFFLSEIDASLRAWSNLRLAGDSAQDMRTLRILERDLARRTQERQGDLIAELESGSPTNRAVSAVALGFTGDAEVQSPLLQALEDPDQEVVNNALLGLGVLGRADTPVTRICDLLAGDPDPWTRNNAAYALAQITLAGNRDPRIVETARDALADVEPGVRAQAASVLGLSGDQESITYLGDLLHDEVNLVAQASASALANIGTTHPESKGPTARLLVGSWQETPRPTQRWIRKQLIALCGEDLGEDSVTWQDWAHRLP